MTYEEMFPCRAQIIRTHEGRDAAPLDDYSYPEKAGEFIGTLAFQCWHRNKPMLLCYFDTDAGQKFVLPGWKQDWGVSYSPAEMPSVLPTRCLTEAVGAVLIGRKTTAISAG